MPIFGTQSNSYLGIDIGGSTIKLVEIKNVSGRASLVTYGYADKPVDKIQGSLLDNPDVLSQMIKDLCAQSGVTTNKVITALPAAAVFSSIISLPNITTADLKDNAKVDASVRWEAKKVVPLPLEEMIIDWKLLPFKKNEDSVHQVLLTGASKKLVKRYMDIFTNAGLSLLSLETESFALTRSLIGNDKSVIMVVDLGALSTYILIVDQGFPFFDRTISTAGFNLTKTISETLGTSMEGAERYKIDLAHSGVKGYQNFPKVFQQTLSSIIHEIKYSFNLYQQDEYGGKKIEKIMLTGGSAMIPHITDYLSDILQTQVYLGDPWARVDYPQDLRPILDDIGSKFAISIGLAMRDLN